MAKCERILICPFFNDKLDMKHDLILKTKQFYCLRNKEICARYKVITAKLECPKDLYPNQREKAEKILSDALATAK